MYMPILIKHNTFFKTSAKRRESDPLMSSYFLHTTPVLLECYPPLVPHFGMPPTFNLLFDNLTSCSSPWLALSGQLPEATSISILSLFLHLIFTLLVLFTEDDTGTGRLLATENSLPTIAERPDGKMQLFSFTFKCLEQKALNST